VRKIGAGKRWILGGVVCLGCRNLLVMERMERRRSYRSLMGEIDFEMVSANRRRWGLDGLAS